MKTMIFVISLMIISGVATFITLVSTLQSLRSTKDAYYQEYYFSNVFATLKRAPNNVTQRIREIPGINRVETRIQAGANLLLDGFDETIRGLIISLPDEGEVPLNRLYIREGRLPDPYNMQEVVLGDAFAQAHNLQAGDKISAVINGQLKSFTIAGIGLSPEYIFQGDPSSIIPDFERFGIMWMRRSSLEATYDMQGAFNNVVASFTWQAHEKGIISQLDEILQPYGGLGATGRRNQQSHFYITEELNQLEQMATLFPAIFLGVAVFLLNVVIGRLIQTQQGQIATLKAFGYSNAEIGLHYLFMVSVILVLGFVSGVLLGMYLGKLLAGVYAEFYRFPFLTYRLDPSVFLLALAVSVFAAFGGALFSIRKAIMLPPAEGMRSDSPAIFKHTHFDRWKLIKSLDQPSKMILRQLNQHKIKVAFSCLGIALAASLVMMGRMSNDSVNYAVEVEFKQASPHEYAISFTDAISAQALYEIKRIRGVDYAEATHSVPVRLRKGHRNRLTSIQAFPDSMKLKVLIDRDGNKISLPKEGMILTWKLGEILDVQVGDKLQVEFLERHRQIIEVPVAGFMDQFFGLGAYMRLDALDRIVQDKSLISGVYMNIDESYEGEIKNALRASPAVAGITSTRETISEFYDSTAQTWLIMAFFVSLFAGATAFSVVYNNARISLSERSRELASLRVLGFTRGEIAYILLGELWLVVLLSIPFGMMAGTGLTAFIITSLETELYRIPMNISAITYTLAALTVIVSALLSSVVIRMRLNRLDLIGVLKERE